MTARNLVPIKLFEEKEDSISRFELAEMNKSTTIRLTGLLQTMEMVQQDFEELRDMQTKYFDSLQTPLDKRRFHSSIILQLFDIQVKYAELSKHINSVKENMDDQANHVSIDPADLERLLQ